MAFCIEYKTSRKQHNVYIIFPKAGCGLIDQRLFHFSTLKLCRKPKHLVSVEHFHYHVFKNNCISGHFFNFLDSLVMNTGYFIAEYSAILFLFVNSRAPVTWVLATAFFFPPAQISVRKKIK